MSCLRIKEYKVLPINSFEVIHTCSGCNGKNNFVNTNSFRINANGECIDVWLIYQCKRCKHTFNIPIYERTRMKNIGKEEYHKLLSNDKELAFKYGTDKQLMKKNKIEIDWNKMDYIISEDITNIIDIGAEIHINNPYQIKIRTEKILSEIMKIPRQEIRKMIQEKKIIFKDKKVCAITKVCFSMNKED